MVRKRKNDTRGGRGLVLLAALLFIGCVSAQQPPAPTSGPAAAFDGARAFEHLKQVVAIGPRPAGSEGARKTRDYIKQQMSALGLTTTEQAFDAATPVGTVKMVNVSVRLPGSYGERRSLAMIPSSRRSLAKAKAATPSVSVCSL